ncbi:MAG: TauD/TfdA family dioxygenase [Bergeyella sp.]|nr:TauD/TfdA family dioxygenase [Bergeyella sp.]
MDMNIEFKEKSTDEIKRLLENNGCYFFEKEFEKPTYVGFCSLYGKIFKHRDSNDDGITIVKNDLKNKDGFYGLSSKELFPHTDRSTEKIVPNLLFLYCKESSVEGGESIIIDSKKILLELISIFGEENVFVSQ